jgi:hypothetical protein
MTKDYYQTPSPIGKPILDLFLEQSDYKQDCIHTLWHLEESKQVRFNTLNGIKYLWRLGQKDPDYRDDLSKAIEYLGWELQIVNNLAADLKQEIESSGLQIDNFPLEAKVQIQLALRNCDIANALMNKVIDACQKLLAEANEDFAIQQQLKDADTKYGSQI